MKVEMSSCRLLDKRKREKTKIEQTQKSEERKKVYRKDNYSNVSPCTCSSGSAVLENRKGFGKFKVKNATRIIRNWRKRKESS